MNLSVKSSVSHYIIMSVITQYGESALMMAVRRGTTEVVSLLLKAGANIHLQNVSECVGESIKLL